MPLPPVVPPHLTAEVQSLLRQLAALTARAIVIPVPLEGWRSEVMVEMTRLKRAATTCYRINQAMRDLIALAGPEATTEALTPELVERFAASRPDRSAKSNNDAMAAIRRACNLAVQWGNLSSCPFGPETPWVEVEDRPRRRHHSRSELGRVLKSLAAGASGWEGGRLQALVAVLSYTGLRKTEALRLKVADVDLESRMLHVRRNGKRLKTRKSAAPVPMPVALERILAGWIPRAGSDWLFPGVKKFGPWTGGTSSKRAPDRIRGAGAGVGVPDFTPSSLRRSAATHLAGWQKLSGKQLQMILRHANQTMQDWYIQPGAA